MGDMSTKEWLERAYKKLKGSVYFDKTQLPLVDQIVEFEAEGIDQKLDALAKKLDGSDDEWEDYAADIKEKTAALIFPKKLYSPDEKHIIFNADAEPVKLERAQYFISMPVIGHILGTLWVLALGFYIDDQSDPDKMKMYEHSYGNRLRKNLRDGETGRITYSPYLFEPYFSQYESWRDTALKYAKEKLASKQDALILTLDLKSFFYSVHFSQDGFQKIYDDIAREVNLPDWAKRVHHFVYSIMEAYSDKVRNANSYDTKLDLGKRVFLPIGFLPSNILSNWYLTQFDLAITERINPVYYGRYVDDIIIVDKVEKNSLLRRKAAGNGPDGKRLTAKDVIDYYFCDCHSGKGDSHKCEQDQLFIPQKCDTNEQTDTSNQSGKKEEISYRISESVFKQFYSSPVQPDIRVQMEKVKVFYFKEGATRALLDCFQTQIGQNASEFRFLPDVDSVLDKNNYSEIFRLKNDETFNKLRGVSEVSLDKLALSKFLGKYRKAGRMINDRKETAFDKELLTFLNDRALIDNFTLWERLLEILIVNNRLNGYEDLAKSLLKAIANYSSESDPAVPRHALTLVLRAALCRTSALCWGKEMESILGRIGQKAQDELGSDGDLFSILDLNEQRERYIRSFMVNKYVLPLSLPYFVKDLYSACERRINLSAMDDFRLYCDWSQLYNGYKFFPYMVTPQDISYALACKEIANCKPISTPKEQIDNIRKLYIDLNYPDKSREEPAKVFEEIDANLISHSNKAYAITVQSPKTPVIKVAVGNARLNKSDFKLALTGKSNRSFGRYRQVAKLFREALTENADILVLPENFLPWEWIPDISRICANNQMALVSGVEHIISRDSNEQGEKGVYNLSVVILPYCKDGYKYAHIVYHHKVRYSPNEMREIKGYRYRPIEGENYELFQWRDLWFSTYTCFELASIADRSIFQSYADLTIGVEWNPDTGYFSNIMEALSRDLHCYCVQANSSDYGDSRVIAPSKTEQRDLLRTKGGLNHTILTCEIDISALRDFQRKEYELQRDDPRFKPTPPGFDPRIVELKQRGELWEAIEKGDIGEKIVGRRTSDS